MDAAAALGGFYRLISRVDIRADGPCETANDGLFDGGSDEFYGVEISL